MDWLLHLDAAAFRWINSGWSNSIFDVAMPFLSGNRFFMPTAFLGGLILLWRGRMRGFLCLAMTLLAIAVGDGFVYPLLKDAISRPRPFEVAQDAVLRINGAHSPSMPSSHAANWMCLAMVMFVYYRRSALITLPIGVMVALSRVYNGVHYPADILAGMLVGAGCGAATLWALNTAWTLIGRRWFPLWREKLPSLVYSPGGDSAAPTEDEPQFRPRHEKGPAAPRHASMDAHWLRLGYILILVTIVVRLLFLAKGPLQLTPDEAYQWHWSKHPALSYFSKPPMIAFAQIAGTTLWGDTAFGVRFLSPLIAAGLGLMLLRFFAREVNARAGFFLLLILTTTPMLAGGAVLLTVDPLSVLFWTAAMLTGWRAIQNDSETSDWAWTGFWMGLGFLSKYTALFQLLSWAAVFWLWPPARKHLRRAGPWVGLLTLALCSLPVLIWNYQHDWVTVAHVAEDAGAGRAWKPTLKYFAEFIGAEFALLNPVWFVGAVWASIMVWRRGRSNPKLVYLFSMGAPLFVVYLLFSLKSRALPNWIAPSIIPLFCMTVIYWDTRLRLGGERVKSWLFAGLALGAVAVVLGHNTALIEKAVKISLPPKMDPMRRGKAWPETAAVVSRIHRDLEKSGPAFIIGDHYGITSELSFYIPESRRSAARHPFVYCRGSETPRNQFHMWPGYERRKGQNAVYVRELSLSYKTTYPPPKLLLDQFESVEELGVRPIQGRHQDQPTRHLQLFVCRRLK
jgi:membrane-associated phospholipid phosphatase